MAQRYPSRFIGPALYGFALVAVLVHSGLLEALRDSLPALYAAYLVICVGAAVLYFILGPYLL
jgi:hypothetical protein